MVFVINYKIESVSKVQIKERLGVEALEVVIINLTMMALNNMGLFLLQ